MFATRLSTAAFALAVMTTVVAWGQVTNPPVDTAAVATDSGDYRILDPAATGVRAFGDTYDLSLFWQCASDCDFVTDPGGGPDSCTGLTYDGVTEACGNNTFSGAGVEVLESETNNGDGTFTVIIQIGSQNGSDLMPNGTECAPGQPINVLGAHLGCDIGCPSGSRAPCDSPSGGDELDPNLPDPPYELLQAKAVVLGAGGQTLLEFDLATAGQTVTELGTQFTVGGVNGVQVTGLQFKFVVDVGELTGACCETNGFCTPGLTAVECVTSGGTYQGDFTTCTPDPCLDCNTNGISDVQEIIAGSASDANSNGMIDACDIAECRSNDLNHNGIPDEADIAAGTAADLDTNGVIDEAEQPSDKHSYIVMPGGNMRDDDVAALLKSILLNTNGTPNVKDAKFFFAECFGGGMLDDIADELGTAIPWVGASASRHDEFSFGEKNDAADPSKPMGVWVRPLIGALDDLTVLLAVKKAALLDPTSPLADDYEVHERAQYRFSGDAARDVTLADPEAASHHAVLVAGKPDRQRHGNNLREFCDLLKQEWGDLDTTGTSVHILFGDGATNPCSGDVPNANVSAANATNFFNVLTNLRNQLNPNEEFVLFVTDHGSADVKGINPLRGLRGAVVNLDLVVPAGYVIGMTRDPFNNHPFIAVVATGAYPPNTIPVQFNGVPIGHLDPAAMNTAGENETLLPIRETLVDIGVNSVSVDTTAAGGVSILSARLDLDGINTIPSPGWGDADGDGDVDGDDVQSVSDCASGPGGGLPAPQCANVDIDDDMDVDLDDYRLLQTVFTGPGEDFD